MTDLIEIKDLVEEQGDAFKAFKSDHDTRMRQLEGDMDTIYKKTYRPGAIDWRAEKSEHFEMFEPYLRHGENEKGLRDFQTKATTMNMGSDPNGGYLVPTEISDEIDSLIRNLSPMRRLAKNVQVQTTDIKFLVSQSDADSGWVSEEESRPVTDGSTLAAIRPAFGEVYCAPKLTQQLADDSYIDIGNWLAADISEKLAEQEGAAFITGTGVNQPRGILTYDTASTADSSRDFGTIQYIATGASGAFTSSAPQDKLIDTVHAMKPGYRQRGAWLMNSSTLAVVRKFKDSNGDPIWSQALTADRPSTLLGYPVYEDENMTDISANSLSIAFGDFMRGYVICDRVGITVLRDPFTSRGNIIFYTRKRVGGALLNSEAIKVIKFAAS